MPLLRKGIALKIERTKNATKNLIWGIIDRCVALLIPFICRSAVIHIFGIHYLGLNSLFSSVLSMLNMTELGFGSAVVFFLYRAIAEDDKNKICALLNYIKRIYQCIGLVVLCTGLALMPFLRFFIKADVPAEVNIYIIYLLSLAGTVLSYFLCAYKEAIFRSHQRIDVLSKISTIVTIVDKALQLLFIFVLRNYYLYISTAILGRALNNALIYLAAKKNYPQYPAAGKLARPEKKMIFDKIRGLFMYKIGNVVSLSADSIVISAFLGLAVVGRHGNYYYIITTLIAFLGVLFTSLRAGIGNSIVTESVEKNFKDFRTLQFAQNWIVGWCTVCLFCLFQDFISIYAGKENLLPIGYVVCLCAYFWIWKIQDVVHVYKEAAGMWTQDRYRPFIGALINLSLNLIMVQFIGLYGVILSTTIVFLCLDIPWASRVLFRNYFESGASSYYKMLLKGLVQMLLMLTPTYLLCMLITLESLVLQLMVKAVVCLIAPNVLYIVMNCHSDEYKVFIRKVKTILKIKN